MANLDFIKKVDNLVISDRETQYDNWLLFKSNFRVFFTAIEADKKPSCVQAAIFLNAVGPEALKVFETFNLAPEEKEDYECVFNAFEDYCTPKKNIVNDSFLFNTRNQQKKETFDAFYEDILKLVKACEYDDEDRMIRDRIVAGVKDKNLQKLFTEREDLDLTMAVEMARAAEASKTDMDDDDEDNSPKKKYEGKPYESNGGGYKGKNFKPKLCPFCKKMHGYGKCRAFGQKCAKCGKMNHFALACFYNTKPQSNFSSNSGGGFKSGNGFGGGNYNPGNSFNSSNSFPSANSAFGMGGNNNF